MRDRGLRFSNKFQRYVSSPFLAALAVTLLALGAPLLHLLLLPDFVAHQELVDLQDDGGRDHVADGPHFGELGRVGEDELLDEFLDEVSRSAETQEPADSLVTEVELHFWEGAS